MTNLEDELCYVALHDCGGWQMLSVITPKDRGRNREQAKEVAACIRAGLRIETWPVSKVRAEAVMCQCLKKKQGKQKELELQP